MDRYNRFAQTWKSIGVSSKVKWRGSHKGKQVTPLILSKMIDTFGDDAIAIIEEVFDEIGREDAKELSANLNKERNDANGSLDLIDMICLLIGLESERFETDDSSSNIRVAGCPYNVILGDINPPGRMAACLKYTEALIKSVNEDVKLDIVKRCCEGDNYCEFVVSVIEGDKDE